MGFFKRDRELLEKIITEKRVGIYAGVDPTAPSLHIGHMLPFMVLAWAYVYGIRAVWLVGLCFPTSVGSYRYLALDYLTNV